MLTQSAAPEGTSNHQMTWITSQDQFHYYLQ